MARQDPACSRSGPLEHYPPAFKNQTLSAERFSPPSDAEKFPQPHDFMESKCKYSEVYNLTNGNLFKSSKATPVSVLSLNAVEHQKLFSDFF